MNLKLAGLISSIALLGALPALAQTTQGPGRATQVRAKIDTGVLVGETKDGLNIFKGVPYAKPPVGDLRWRAPQKPDSWKAERYATAFESPCPQPARADGKSANGGGVLGATNEDCLYLNVYAPANARKAPVVVWLHGGASYLGAGHLGGYHGASNAAQGVITIPINYRLGSLGSFAHPALTKEAKAKGEPTGAFALMDAVAALAWVKRNAAAFGGDPDNITLAGQSAGGGMVMSLLSIPSAKGLYHKAIVQSGAGLRPGTALADAEIRGDEVVTAMGYARASAADLRGISAGTLVGHAQTQRGFTAATDGVFKTVSTMDALNSGTEIDVPVMVGANTGEYGFDAARTAAKLAGDTGAGAWLYQFAYVPEWGKAAQPQGAPHSAELVYTFDSWNHSSAGDARVNATDRAVSKRVNSCWVAFYRMDPKAQSLACADGFVWPAYTEAADDAARFGETPSLVKSKTLPNGPPPGSPRDSTAPD